MSRAGKSGTQPFTRTQARQRLSYGRKCFDVAELIGDDDDWAPKVAVSLNVLAGIAAADAITGAKDAGRALGELLDLKDKAQYSPHLVSSAEEMQASRRAQRLLDTAAAAPRG